MCVCVCVGDDGWSLPLTGHTQYISTIVKDKMADCRRDFGVQFMFDVIRIFYRSAETCLVVPVLWLVECMCVSPQLGRQYGANISGGGTEAERGGTAEHSSRHLHEYVSLTCKNH